MRASPRIEPDTPATAAPTYTLRDRSVLLATDGSPAAAAAARVTAALASERQARPHIARVLDLSAYAIPRPLPGLVAAADVLVGRDLRAPDAAALRAELGELLGARVDWPAYADIGTPSEVIARDAARIGAALVVMGLRRHGKLERAIGDETTLRVMRRAQCPVLGATPRLAGLPKRAVVGIDFGRASVSAARAALALLAPQGTLLLTSVQPPREAPREENEGAAVVHALGVAAAFERLARELAGDGVRIEPVVLELVPGAGVTAELLALADRAGADLLAVGSQQHGRLDRWLLGSVTSALARDGRHSLLAVPPRPARGAH